MATIWMTGGEWGVSEFDFGGSPVVAGFGVLSPRTGTYVYRINYTDYYKRFDYCFWSANYAIIH